MTATSLYENAGKAVLGWAWGRNVATWNASPATYLTIQEPCGEVDKKTERLDTF